MLCLLFCLLLVLQLLKTLLGLFMFGHQPLNNIFLQIFFLGFTVEQLLRFFVYFRLECELVSRDLPCQGFLLFNSFLNDFFDSEIEGVQIVFLFVEDAPVASLFLILELLHFSLILLLLQEFSLILQFPLILGLSEKPGKNSLLPAIIAQIFTKVGDLWLKCTLFLFCFIFLYLCNHALSNLLGGILNDPFPNLLTRNLAQI